MPKYVHCQQYPESTKNQSPKKESQFPYAPLMPSGPPFVYRNRSEPRNIPDNKQRYPW